MSFFTLDSRFVRHGLPAFVAVAALGLSGCGGGSDDVASDATGDQGSKVSEDSGADESSDLEEQTDVDAPDPVAVLPFEIDVPSGYMMQKASCEAGGPKDPDRPSGEASESSDDEDDEFEYSTWITYAVPETWDNSGRGSAGSGGVTGDDEDLTFSLDDGESKGKVNVDVSWDNMDFDGTITDGNGDPWESFDYDSSIGDDKATITYESVATLEAGEQEADLFYRDPAQAPDHISGTQYKVRLNAFELPRQTTGESYELVPQSFVVTIEFDEEDTPLDQETIESIVESFVLPECSWDKTLLDHELLLNLDLNGDGHIRNSEDIQEELKDMQKDMEKKLDELREESSDD